MSPEQEALIRQIAREAAQEVMDRQGEQIAELAADRALHKVYAVVGRTLLTRMLWALGAAAIAAAGWLTKGAME